MIKTLVFASLTALIAGCDKAPLADAFSSGSTTGIPASKKNFVALGYQHYQAKGSTIHLVSFDDRKYRLNVADQPKGPGSKWEDAKSAAKANKGLAAINAGFFTPEGKPLGLCIDDGDKRGHLNHSSLGSGAFLYDSKKGSYLIRKKRISHFSNIRELLQSGPFLVENGAVIKKLKTSESRPRSFIVHDNRHGWILGHATSLTMQELAEVVSQINIPNLKVRTALNLDGGRSCQLYIGAEVATQEKQITTFMNRKVRNFLVLQKK